MFTAKNKKTVYSWTKSGCLAAIIIFCGWIAFAMHLTAQGERNLEPAVQVVEVTATPIPSPTPSVNLEAYLDDILSLHDDLDRANTGLVLSLNLADPMISLGDSETGWEIWSEGHMDSVRASFKATEAIIDYDEDKVPSCLEEAHEEMVSGMEAWKTSLELQANAIYLEDVGMIRESGDYAIQAGEIIDGATKKIQENEC